MLSHQLREAWFDHRFGDRLQDVHEIQARSARFGHQTSTIGDAPTHGGEINARYNSLQKCQFLSTAATLTAIAGRWI